MNKYILSSFTMILILFHMFFFPLYWDRYRELTGSKVGDWQVGSGKDHELGLEVELAKTQLCYISGVWATRLSDKEKIFFVNILPSKKRVQTRPVNS